MKKAARKAFRLWSDAPFHPSLHFKKVGKSKWSARVGSDYRSVGRFNDGFFVWSWIGSHAAYDNLLKS